MSPKSPVKRLTTPNIVSAVGGLVLALGLSCDAVLDIKPPHVKIVSPADGDSIRGGTLVRVEADDQSVSRLQLYLDDSLVATASQSPLEVTPELDTSFSTHRLRAVAYDRGGNWSEDRTTVVRLVPRVSLTLLSTYDTPGSALDFAIAGEYLYVADSSSLIVLSLANPTAPAEVGSFSGGHSYYCDVHVAGSLACVADYTGKPNLFDVSDPCAPRLLSTLGIHSGASGVYCGESLAYAVSWRDTFYVADISNPSVPVILGRCKITANPDLPVAVHIEKPGNYAYVMSSSYGAEVVDVTNPSTPLRVAGLFHSNESGLGHLAIWHDTVYYASDACVGVADVARPTNPVDLGSFQVRGDVSGLATDDSLLYVASARPQSCESLHVLSRADGTERARALALGTPMSVAVVDSFLYVACKDAGIKVYQRKQEWVVK